MRGLKGVCIARVSTVPYFMVTQLRQQIDYLANVVGARVYIVTSPGQELDEINQCETLHTIEIKIARSISPVQDLVTFVRLFFFFCRSSIDIVHSTTPKAGLLCAIAGFFARVPVRLHTFTGQPWVRMTGFIRRLSIVADRIIVRLNTRCYADSCSQADFLIANGIIEQGKIHVLGKGSLAGVDLSRFDPEKWDHQKQQQVRKEIGIAEHAFVILFVGRIARDKGILDLIESFHKLAAKHDKVHLALIGPLDEEAGGNSSLSHEQFLCHKRIHYLGYRSCPEQFMAMADILCLPSYREGFGTVVIEAAAMETPTVGTRIYGLTDAVVDGETGLLVPVGDVESLTAAIDQLVEDKQMCRELGKNARKYVESYYDAEKMNRRLAREYELLLARLRDGTTG